MYFSVRAKVGPGVKKAMRRLFRFRKKEDETLAEYNTMTARIARKIWTEIKLPIQSEVIAESM